MPRCSVVMTSLLCSAISAWLAWPLEIHVLSGPGAGHAAHAVSHEVFKELRPLDSLLWVAAGEEPPATQSPWRRQARLRVELGAQAPKAALTAFVEQARRPGLLRRLWPAAPAPGADD